MVVVTRDVLALAPVLALALAAPAQAGEPALVAAGIPARAHRTVADHAPAPFSSRLGDLAGWRQLWDVDTGVPLRLWGPSVPVFASTADPAIAERAARGFVAAHLALLAPGSAAADLVVVANQLDPGGHIRTVGFAQYAGGLRVEGAGVGVVFERDHLVVASSTAIPDVHVTVPAARLARPALELASRAFAPVAAHVPGGARAAHAERVILPIVRPTGIELRVAESVEVEADADPRRWQVWLDAATGAPIARRALVVSAAGTINFDVPDRYPAGTRSAQPAPDDTHTINGVPATSDADGVVTFAGANPATVTPGLEGPLIAVFDAQGTNATDTLQLADGSSVTWSRAGEPAAEAQLAAFIHASAAKRFVRERLDPALAFLDRQLAVNVNEVGSCNAYSSGDELHFYAASAACDNIGLLADIIYHELGHSVHLNSIVPGVGAYDQSLSEGLADTLAVSITGDPGVGRGFYYGDTPLRDLAPATPKRWPEDADGEVHDEGEIIGEALYDLRRGLEAARGTAPGFARFLTIFDGELQRAADIPSSYVEALVSDDDDGDLSNGVPDQCAIDAAFAAHGLTHPAETLRLAPPTRTGYTVALAVPAPLILDPACPPPTIASAVLRWRLESDAATLDLPMARTGDGFRGDLPVQPDGTTLRYRVVITLSDGTELSYPRNLGDPDYQMYVGPVIALQCFDFEDGAEGWTHVGDPVERDQWQVGAPQGLGGDPAAAYDGTNVLGITLDGDGRYKSLTKQAASSPPIDLRGHRHVHLQYERWLTVEDGARDHATIAANGTTVWTNPGTSLPHGAALVDQEWRFHDVDLGEVDPSMPLVVSFGLASSRNYQLGGWNLDHVCVVAPQATGGGGCAVAGDPAATPLGLIVVLVLRRRRRHSALP